MGPPTGRPTRIPEDEVPQFPAPDEQDETDSPATPGGRYSVRRRTTEHVYRRNTSTREEVMDEAQDVFLNYMDDMFNRDGISPSDLPEELQGRRREVNSETARCLQQIGDDLVGNRELNHLINEMPISKETAFETFASVAQQIFGDGVINWGRVVALLYFGYRLVVRVLCDGKLLMKIVKWVLQFISERLVKWIMQEGGWVSNFKRNLHVIDFDWS
eukprot:gene18057-19866_t